MPKLSIGFSPCPNDTFIFGGLFTGAVPSDFDFDFAIEDVEQLNQKVLSSSIDVCKVSFFTYAKVQDKYALLTSGAALGNGCGPLLVSRSTSNSNLEKMRVAIPGENTTAFSLLRILYPKIKNFVAVPYFQIEDYVKSGECDLGLLIHEGRFTYVSNGLNLISDLGEEWQFRFRCLIPLGCIVAKNSLGFEVHQKLSIIIKASLELARSGEINLWSFIEKYSQVKDRKVIQEHIDLYVNEHSLCLNDEARRAIKIYLDEVAKIHA